MSEIQVAEQFQEEAPKISKFRSFINTFLHFTKIFFFEFIGTALFSYGIVCAQGSDALVSAYLFAAIFLTCKFTGGHVNPAVSYCFYLNGEMDWKKLQVYWTAQFGGAFAGALGAFTLLWLRAAPIVRDGTIEQLLSDTIAEALGTFLFIIMIQIQTHDDTKLTNNDVAGIGLISGALYVGRGMTFHTGGCLNPAMGVSLPLFMFFISLEWRRITHIWVFLVGPTLGAYLAHRFYKEIYRPFKNLKELQ